MAIDTTSIKIDTFGDIVSIIENRAKIAGTVQDRDRNLIKGAVNEYYVTVSTERNWRWRKFDRDFYFDLSVTTGTVSVTKGSRVAVFTGLTLDDTYRHRSIKITGTQELYRIVGLDLANNTAFLSQKYVQTTNALATFNIYQYEFPLPPDCDVISQVYIDSPSFVYGNETGELSEKNNLEFNRLLSGNSDIKAIPYCYTRDGQINVNSAPPLDVMISDYDFLEGDAWEDVDKIRFLPIEPDVTRLIHMNYSVHVEPMALDTDRPIIPVDNRWILVHYGLAVWHARNGSGTMADREFAIAQKMLHEMRCEFHKTDTKPKIVLPKRRFMRTHMADDTVRDKFLQARKLEY